MNGQGKGMQPPLPGSLPEPGSVGNSVVELEPEP